jgi:2-polyprenyl-3-methyl-5-hydroxy-6-metoxy-1,4-benzoquinol methylase
VLERCSACTLVWQRFAPTLALLRRLYDGWEGSEGLGHQDNVEYHRSVAEEVLLALQLVGRRPSEVAMLDFGMGWGRWVRMATAFGCRAEGTELADPQIEFARSQGVRVVELDALEAGTYDFVNCEQIFEHLVEPRATLIALSRALAPGGWVKINVPEGRDIERRLQNPDFSAPRRTASSLVAIAPLEHLNCFNRKALETLGERAGLQRAFPPLGAVYAATIGMWPPQRFARGLVRPPLRRVAPRAVPNRKRTTPGATFFQKAPA